MVSACLDVAEAAARAAPGAAQGAALTLPGTVSRLALAAAATADQAARLATGTADQAVRLATGTADQAVRLVAGTADAAVRRAGGALGRTVPGLAGDVAQAAQALSDLGPRRGRRRVWSEGGHAAIEVRGLAGRGTARRVGASVGTALRRVKGVRWAEVNAVTAQVLVAFDERQVTLSQLVEAVEAEEEAHGTAAEEFSWDAPVHPSDATPLAAAYTALAADIAGVCTGVAGRVLRIRPLHPALRLPLSVLDSYPRAHVALARRIGPTGADVILAVGNAAVYGLSDGPARPAVDALHRLLLAAEVRARMDLWAERAPAWCRDDSQCPAEPPRHLGRPCPFPPGPIERYNDQAAAGSLLAAAGVLAATRQPGRAADAILAGVPRAARLGREGFAATLGGALAREGILPMDAGALRRIDRVSAVLIDSAVLCGERPIVLSAAASGGDATDADVWKAAGAVLRDVPPGALRGPGPWAGHGHRLVRAADGRGHEPRPGPVSPHQAPAGREPSPGQLPGPEDPPGLRLAVLTAGGGRLGEVTVGCELDPLAEAVLATAHAGGTRVLITRHASTAELAARADEVVDGGLADRVTRLAAGGAGVLLIASADHDALAAADVSVSCVRDGAAVGWAADLICGPGLLGVWRVLMAVRRARGVSERAVTLAVSGSTLSILLAAVGPRRKPGEAAFSIGPEQAAALLSLLQGAYTARAVARATAPAPAPRTAWHAMDAGEVVARLDAARSAAPRTGPGGTTGAGLPAAARRWRDDLAGRPVTAPVVGVLEAAAGLAASTVRELRDPLTPVLLIGAAASAVLGSGVDSALVASVMAGNALVGGVQRLRTERALHDLLLREQQAARRVRREPGGPVPEEAAGAAADVVPASALRPGDLIVLRSDDVVPADARLLCADAVEVDESTLTGESLPVAKNAAAAFTGQLAERASMVYEGTTVLAGTAVAVVVASGDATEAGRAALAAAGAPRPAGVQARLGDLTRMALPATGLGGLAVTGLSMLRGAPLRAALGAGVAVAVAAVPEGLPLVATVAQLAAARRLSRRGLLVRSPRTLEALGRVDVLCFDKTGTLTEGRLEVAAAAAADGAGLGLDSPPGRAVLEVAARSCPAPGQRQTHATDQAVQHTAAAAGFDGGDVVDEVPFQASRGYSASLRRVAGQLTLAVKGSPEAVLGRCATVRTGPGEAGAAVPFTGEHRRAAQETVDQLAAEGLRVLAVAERTAGPREDGTGRAEDLMTDLTLAGFIGIADVIRADSARIIEDLTGAGVRVLVVTGDHPVTAGTIARKAGIPDADQVITGAELDRLAEGERRAQAGRCAVFARVSPEQKLRIVADLQRAGHVVAMTGDGTNDAAAIRLADVGIGVAARGSTAARSAADLILPGGDIAQIAEALREGRALWRSVRDALSILLGGNAGEIVFMIIGTALAGRSPLNTRQLLLVNMLTDMFPALAVALGERANGEDLSAGPAPPLLGAPLARAIAVRGGATALGATLAWAGGRVTGRRTRAATMGLAAVIATQLGQTLLANARSPVVIATTVVSAGVLVLVVNTPGISQFFGCTPLGPAAWAIVAASSAAATAAGAVIPRFLPAE